MILQRLREATRPDHERLEEHIDLLGRSWSVGFYRALIEKFYGMYAVLEPMTLHQKQWGTLGVDVEKRAKLPALIQDLRFLGLSDSEIEALPHYPATPTILPFAAALGTAYVMEGSTLGGQIISRHLNKELGLKPNGGLAFFGSYGAEVGPMWREFTEALNTYKATDEEQAIAAASAVETFQAFDIWFSDIL